MYVLILACIAPRAALTVLDLNSTTNHPCDIEGLVMCSEGHFQTCASGRWSVEQDLAQGTNCSIFSSQSGEAFPTQTYTAATSSIPILPNGTAPAPNMTEDQLPSPSVTYSGPASNFPPLSLWLSFKNLWKINKSVCELNPRGTPEIIRRAILQTADKSGVDARIIFAVILQESTCLLSAATTYGSSTNSGLMQSHNGVGYTDQASILQMIRDGTCGTYYKVGGGDGLLQTTQKLGIYGGLRAYNSGDLGVNSNDLSSAKVGTPSYVSDIANRLVGAKIAH